MLYRLFNCDHNGSHMLGLKFLSHNFLSTCTMALLLGLISAPNFVEAYTLQGPRYSSAPNPKPQEQQAVAPQENKTQELSLEEQAIIKEQNEFMAQIQNSIVPNVELENKEIETIVATGDTPLLIYGSAQLDKFLGCLNCHPKYSISVWNAQGPYGSSRGDFSIWNTLFEFGNVKSRLCPWNKFASNPPAVIDPKGTFYGFLTSNSAINPTFKNNFTLTLLLDFEDIGLSPQQWFESTFAKQLANNNNTVLLKDLEALPKPVPKEQRLLPAREQRAIQIAPQEIRRSSSPFEGPREDPYQYQPQENNQPFKFP